VLTISWGLTFCHSFDSRFFHEPTDYHSSDIVKLTITIEVVSTIVWLRIRCGFTFLPLLGATFGVRVFGPPDQPRSRLYLVGKVGCI